VIGVEAGEFNAGLSLSEAAEPRTDASSTLG
jgi:hypothetical protein